MAVDGAICALLTARFKQRDVGSRDAGHAKPADRQAVPQVGLGWAAGLAGARIERSPGAVGRG